MLFLYDLASDPENPVLERAWQMTPYDEFGESTIFSGVHDVYARGNMVYIAGSGEGVYVWNKETDALWQYIYRELRDPGHPFAETFRDAHNVVPLETETGQSYLAFTDEGYITSRDGVTIHPEDEASNVRIIRHQPSAQFYDVPVEDITWYDMVHDNRSTGIIGKGIIRIYPPPMCR